MEQTVYDAAGGREGLLALAHAWHVRCLADPVVQPMRPAVRSPATDHHQRD